MEQGYERLQNDASSKSLLKEHLTEDVLDALKNRKTPKFGSTLQDVIQSGERVLSLYCILLIIMLCCL